MDAPAIEMVKLCAGPCCRARALSWFRPRTKGGEARHSLCRECHALAEKHRRERQRHRKVASFAGELTRAKDKDEATRVCRMAIAGFGGVYGFTKRLWETYEFAKPGSPTATKIMLALLRLQELVAPPSPEHEAAKKASWIP